MYVDPFLIPAENKVIDDDDVSANNIHRLWQRRAEQCLIDMSWLEKYLITRGGRSRPTTIEPSNVEFPSNPVEPLHPVREAMAVEKRLLEDLERLCALAIKNYDLSLANAIEGRFLRKQIRYVKDWGDLMRHIVRVSKVPGLGLFEMDERLGNNQGRIPWSHYNDPDLHHSNVHGLCENIRSGLDLSSGSQSHSMGETHPE